MRRKEGRARRRGEERRDGREGRERGEKRRRKERGKGGRRDKTGERDEDRGMEREEMEREGRGEREGEGGKERGDVTLLTDIALCKPGKGALRSRNRTKTAWNGNGKSDILLKQLSPNSSQVSSMAALSSSSFQSAPCMMCVGECVQFPPVLHHLLQALLASLSNESIKTGSGCRAQFTLMIWSGQPLSEHLGNDQGPMDAISRDTLAHPDDLVLPASV